MHSRLTVNDYPVNPFRWATGGSLERMGIKDTVAANLDAAMRFERDRDYHLSTQMGLARRSKVAQATIGRILRGETAAAVDTLEALARPYSLHAWQLLVETFDPAEPPVLPTRTQQELYRSLQEGYKRARAIEQDPDSPVGHPDSGRHRAGATHRPPVPGTGKNRR